jgi:hypothetical protein
VSRGSLCVGLESEEKLSMSIVPVALLILASLKTKAH